MIIIIIVFFVIALILAIICIKNKIKLSKLLHKFKKCNVIVFGKKGSGKDLVFQYVINKRKKRYYSNISYGGKHKKITVNDISVSPNTYDNLINNDIKLTKKHLKENTDIYLSDCGIYLPSQFDTKLYKTYPSFTVYYALSRHLTNSNIHCNTQNLDRVWKGLREHADFYVKVKETLSLPLFLLTKIVMYDTYQSAQQQLNPLSSRILNKYSKAEYDLYQATNGNILSAWILQPKKRIKYDTRYFHKLFYKRKAPRS